MAGRTESAQGSGCLAANLGEPVAEFRGANSSDRIRLLPWRHPDQNLTWNCIQQL